MCFRLWNASVAKPGMVDPPCFAPACYRCGLCRHHKLGLTQKVTALCRAALGGGGWCFPWLLYLVLFRVYTAAVPRGRGRLLTYRTLWSSGLIELRSKPCIYTTQKWGAARLSRNGFKMLSRKAVGMRYGSETEQAPLPEWQC